MRKSGSNFSFFKKAPYDFQKVETLAFLYFQYIIQQKANTFVRFKKTLKAPRR